MQDILDMTVPIVVETSGRTERAYDIFSRLLKDRIVLLGSEVNDAVASLICAQLLFLESQDPEKEIYLYINSPGRLRHGGHGHLRYHELHHPAHRHRVHGRAASMGAFLLSSGPEGYALRPAQQPGDDPPAPRRIPGTGHRHRHPCPRDPAYARDPQRLLAKHTGQPIEKIAQDTERDNFMTAEMAQAYGLVDKVLASRRDLLAEKSE